MVAIFVFYIFGIFQKDACKEENGLFLVNGFNFAAQQEFHFFTDNALRIFYSQKPLEVPLFQQNNSSIPCSFPLN